MRRQWPCHATRKATLRIARLLKWEKDMYHGSYSSQRSSRGTPDELHWAMILDPGSFTSHALRANHAVPFMYRDDAMPNASSSGIGQKGFGAAALASQLRCKFCREAGSLIASKCANTVRYVAAEIGQR
eukprot:3026021-Pleurochrysis_carterae.AAC.1